MFVSDALSRFQTEANRDGHEVIFLKFYDIETRCISVII